MIGVELDELSPVQEEIPSLLAEAQGVLQRLQQALAKLIARIPGGIKRPMDLQHALGEDYKVCWQVFHFVQAENPVAVAHHVPSAVLMRKFLSASTAAGVPNEIVGRAAEAIREFNAMAEGHADDRAAFDAILATISGGAAESLGVQHRRKAFRSESLLWGVQTGVLLSQFFVKVSDDGAWHDVAYVIFKHELRRLRPNVMPLLHGFKPSNTDDLGRVHKGALEPESMEKYGAPLMPAFCSQPSPRLLSVPAGDGWVYSLLNSKELGRKGSATVAFGGMSHIPLNRKAPRGLDSKVNVQITMPTELVLLEVFLHRDSFEPGTPVFDAGLLGPGIGPGRDELPEVLRRALQLDLREKIQSLGPVPEIAPLTKVPRYAEMMDHVFARVGWSSEEFDAYRLEVPYPMLHSEMELRSKIRDDPRPDYLP